MFVNIFYKKIKKSKKLQVNLLFLNPKSKACGIASGFISTNYK